MFNLVRRRRRGLIAGGVAASAALAAFTLGAVPAMADNYNYTVVWNSSYGSTSAQNQMMIGSGSSTTYYMMQALDTIFNDSPGCQIFDPSGHIQPLNFSCTTDDKFDVTTNTDGGDVASASELGPTPPAAGANQFNGINENPYNDVSVQEPYLGSSNGIAQLENSNTSQPFKNTCAHAPTGDFCPAAPLSYARSSRAIGKNSSGGITDEVGLNFVAYAEDGVDWMHFTATPGATSYYPSSGLTNLTGSQIEQIWTGQVSNWAQITGNWTSDNAPICVYTAQDGSGTLATWDTFLDNNGSSDSHASEDAISTLTPDYSAAVAAAANITGWNGQFSNGNPGCVDGTSYTYNSGTNTVTEGTSQASSYGASHQIFENETKSLIAVGLGGNDSYADTQDSIFFMSYGRFNQICSPHVTAACSPTGFTVSMGQVNGVQPTETDIICGDEPAGCGGTQIFPVQRYLYNVYGNGDTSPTNPVTPASANVLNYVSEIGFLCKPQTYTYQLTVRGRLVTYTGKMIDPNTGGAYRTEIQNAILHAGFFPVPEQTAGEDVGTVTYSATALLNSENTAYNTATGQNLVFTYADPYSSTIGGPQSAGIQSTNLGVTNPVGYCKVFTTG